MPDHVHLLISLSKEKSVSEVLRVVKTNSSRWLHQTFPDNADFAWQAGYAAFAVNQSVLENVKGYIAKQKEHHRTVTFRDELLALLNRHNIACDDQYVFEEDDDAG